MTNLFGQLKKMILVVGVCSILIGSSQLYVPQVHAEADLILIEQKIQQTVLERKQQQQHELQVAESDQVKQDLEDVTLLENQPVDSLPPDKVLYSWWQGRIILRRVSGNWYLSIK